MRLNPRHEKVLFKGFKQPRYKPRSLEPGLKVTSATYNPFLGFSHRLNAMYLHPRALAVQRLAPPPLLKPQAFSNQSRRTEFLSFAHANGELLRALIESWLWWSKMSAQHAW